MWLHRLFALGHLWIRHKGYQCMKMSLKSLNGQSTSKNKKNLLLS